MGIGFVGSEIRRAQATSRQLESTQRGEGLGARYWIFGHSCDEASGNTSERERDVYSEDFSMLEALAMFLDMRRCARTQCGASIRQLSL